MSENTWKPGAEREGEKRFLAQAFLGGLGMCFGFFGFWFWFGFPEGSGPRAGWSAPGAHGPYLSEPGEYAAEFDHVYAEHSGPSRMPLFQLAIGWG